MSTIIIPQNIDAETDNAKLYLPVTDGLQYIMIGTDSVKKATHNFAPRKKDGQAVGSIGMTGNVAKFVSMSAYVQTDVAETAEFTVIFVAKTDDAATGGATQSVVCGTFQSLPQNGETVNTYGTAVYFPAKTQIAFAAGRGTSTADDNSALATLATDVTKYQLYVARVVGTKNEIKNLTAATVAEKVMASPRLLSVATQRIGSSYTAFGGHCQVAFLAYYSKSLTDIEIDSVAKSVRKIMLKKGIAI